MKKTPIEMLTSEEESLLLFVGMTFATPQTRVEALRKVADRIAQTAPKDSPEVTAQRKQEAENA